MVEKVGQLEHSSLPFDPNDPATQQWIAAGGFGAMTIEVSGGLGCVGGAAHGAWSAPIGFIDIESVGKWMH